MSLVGALQVGKTALAVHQAAIQVTGNNIANAGNANYTRQVAQIAPNADQQLRAGVYVGTGLNLTGIQRQIDEALEGRLRGAFSDAEAADTTQQWLGRVEAVFNELTDQDLSTQLSIFFNSWSNLANKPQDIGLRQVVLQTGDALAKSFVSLRGDLGDLEKDVADRLTALAAQANNLAQQIADLNSQIVTAEGGTGGQANGLRDQRDVVLKELSQLIDINVVDTGDGMLNVNVGSEPLVAGILNRGVAVKTQVIDGRSLTSLAFVADNGGMNASAGQLGALTQVRQRIETSIDDLDTLAATLIFEVNKLHSTGQGLEGYTTTTSTNAVDDAAAVLNSDDTGLDFAPVNGSFVIHVNQSTGGLSNSTLVRIDLDGQDGDDTTLSSLAADLDAIDGVSATIVGGKLRIVTDSPDSRITFSQDSSGVLAALGINAFFTGASARTMALNPTLRATPSLLAAARNGETGDNQTARAIAGLESVAIASLGGASLKEKYQAVINGVAVEAQSARTNAEAARVVKETLQAQREALSGVSLDEEAINLVRQQRAFQGAARLIAAIDEMMKTVLNLV